MTALREEIRQSNPSTRLPKIFVSLSHPPFRWYLLGMFCCYIPMTMQQVAQGYLAFSLTGSATSLGVVAVAFGLPQLLFTLFAGVIADRYDRSKIVSISQGLIGILAVSMALLIHTGLIQIWHIVVVGLLQGTIFSFNMPARQGLLPEIVPESLLANAVVTNNNVFNLLRILGPSVAGALIAIPTIGVAGVYDVMAVAYFLAMIAMGSLKGRNIAPKRERRAMYLELHDAMGYMWNSRVLSTMFLVGIAFVLFGMPYMMMMPVFAVRVFEAGPAGLGLLSTLGGVGALVGTLMIAAYIDRIRRDLAQVFAAISFGVFMFLFAATDNFLLACLVMPFIGASSNMYMSLNNAQVMLNTEREYVGRVSSIYMLMWSFMPLSSFPISAVVDMIGAQQTFRIMSVLVIVCVTSVAYWRMRTPLPSPKQAG